MKLLPLLTCLFAALLLSACATRTERKPAGPASQYMYQTERNAQARMVKIYWVNPPKSEQMPQDEAKGSQ